MATNKATGHITQRPFRFSRIQTHLSESIKDLIGLYYLFKENGKPFIPDMERLLKRVTGQDLRYDVEAKKFMRGHYSIGFGNRQKRFFVQTMDALCRSIIKGETLHFDLGVAPLEPEIVNDIQAVKGNKPPKYGKIRNGKLSYSIETLRKQGQNLHQRSHGGSGRSSTPFRFFDIKPTSLFGSYFLSARNWGEPHDKIPLIPYDGWVNFIQIARSLLVNYHFAFGNFERLKVCRQCKKLCFEKRGLYKVFCSDDCRVKYSQESEPQEKLQCRAKQNSWIRYRLDYNAALRGSRLKPDHVRKSDCEKCDTCMRSGECPALIERNKKAFGRLLANE